ncbi:hypothetical protein JW916_08380 [Candidatus Sumerlaeota bacterium]|nr:hypothetical protein [Candidatus Sumerlaeota bacterium]
MIHCLTECLSKTLQVFATPICLEYLALFYVLSAVALPLSHRLFNRSRIAWFAASRLLGLSSLTYLAWFLGHNGRALTAERGADASGGFLRGLSTWIGLDGLGIVPYRAWTLYALLAAGAILSAWAYVRWGGEIAARFRRRWKAIVSAEIVFLLVFAFGCMLRMYSDGIRNYEKPMDFAFLNSCIYTHELPPPDPWRYEGPINYYYGGYLQMATAAKMTAAAPEVAYNLSVALVFALTAFLSFALAYELAPRIRWALLGVATVALMGNLYAGVQIWQYATAAPLNRNLKIDWWAASRVIHDTPLGDKDYETINEFPFFSWFHADLHPHMMAVPFLLLYVAILLNLLKARRAGLSGLGRGGWKWARLVFMAWALGSLAMINGFDFIVAIPLLAAVLLVREWWKAHGRIGAWAPNLLLVSAVALIGATWGAWRLRAMLATAYSPDAAPWTAALGLLTPLLGLGALAAAVACGATWRGKARPTFPLATAGLEWVLIVFVAVVLVAPFFLNYHAPLATRPLSRPHSGASVAEAVLSHFQRDALIGISQFRSGPAEYLTMWGTHLYVLAVYVFVSLLPLVRRLAPEKRLFAWCAVAAVWLGCFVWEGTAIAATLMSLLLLAPVGFVVQRKTPARVAAFVLITICILILLCCEHFYIRDVYGRGLQRMNTLFKFFFASWVLIGLTIPFCLRFIARSPDLAAWKRHVLVLGALALIAAAMVYPTSVTCLRIRRYLPSVSGPPDLDGMRYLKREQPGDWAAIQWLRSHTSSGEVVLEAPGERGYTYHGRIAEHTPLRAVLGWAGHESIWRGEYPVTIVRDAKKMYSSLDMGEVESLLEKHGVDYVYVGRLEKQEFPPAALAKFRKTLPIAYEDSTHGVIIYTTQRAATERP